MTDSSSAALGWLADLLTLLRLATAPPPAGSALGAALLAGAWLTDALDG